MIASGPQRTSSASWSATSPAKVVPGVDVGERPGAGVEQAEEQSDEHTLGIILAKLAVYRLGDRRRRAILGAVIARILHRHPHQASRPRHEHRGRRTFAGDVADQEA